MFLIRFLATASIIVVYLIHALIARFVMRDDFARRRYAARMLGNYSCAIWKALRITVQVRGLDQVKPSRGYFIVSNHQSYLDVSLLSPFLHSLFVTSVEVQRTPGLGQICEAGGSLFVERRSRMTLKAELDQIGGILHRGQNITVFPEATTSDGQAILPFKNALFDSAARCQVPVLPVCIRYLCANGKPLTPKTRDSICYYGDMGFFQHFVRLMRLRSIEASIEILEPIEPNPSLDRKALAQLARKKIESSYRPAVATRV